MQSTCFLKFVLGGARNPDRIRRNSKRPQYEALLERYIVPGFIGRSFSLSRKQVSVSGGEIVLCRVEKSFRIR